MGFLACRPELPEAVHLAMQHVPEEIDFNLHIKPILSDRCFSCHGPDQAKREAGLRLDLEETAFQQLPENPGKYAIKPGNLKKSEVFHRILHDLEQQIMPPPESNLDLSAREKAILIRWIESGAKYKPHWAFLKPEKYPIPNVKNIAQTKNDIDPFILEILEQKGGKLSNPAAKEILLRRVSFDLTGLPPTLEEIDHFLDDTSPEAYEKVVDRLLASPHFGERMATEWMDVARFADTHGYTVDRYRDMSPWRDWVIQAFNQNLAYDQFVIWQLAGDLLPNATTEQKLATGFNRNHQQNMEGGIVPEEFRVEYVADRTNTLGKAFLGITMECARCHDHKFDPITQKNYYELFSFFNNIDESGQISWNDAMPVPTMLLPDAQTEEKIHKLDEKIKIVKQEIKDLEASHAARWEQWLVSKQSSPTYVPVRNKMSAFFDLSQSKIQNQLPPYQNGTLRQQFVTAEIVPIITNKKNQKGLLLDGDAWLELGQAGVFNSSTPFSIGIRTYIPDSLETGVLFHKGIGAVLYNFRGYHLALVDNRLEVLMAHTSPYNAIIEYTDSIPKDQWIHLMMTYDGSLTAKGFKIYLNGRELATEVTNDHLYKDIRFFDDPKKEPGLQIGARWRGIGAKGAAVQDVSVFKDELSALEVLEVFNKNAGASLLHRSKEVLSLAEADLLKSHFLKNHIPGIKEKQFELQSLLHQKIDIQHYIQEVMVMDERKTPRPSHVLERGLYNLLGDRVFPNTPASIFPMPQEFPKNRLGLAQWLFHPDHPLTSRVIVNRLWSQFFGKGLVSTPDDFGNQGALPSHPKLLDWLAINFLDSGWDLKQLAKLMVTSATYRQSSQPGNGLEDPENKYLSRGPSARLSAEMLRDNALAASGLIVKKIGGTSVKPYQPPGLWKINGSHYEPDQGENLFRRSLYTFWKRTVPNPTQATFDAPTRANCTVERQKTSTPLQALVIMNDPVFVEAAKVIGAKMSENAVQEESIQWAFRGLTGRKASPAELQLLLEMQQTEAQKFTRFPEKAKGWLETGNYELITSLNPAVLAANTVVASTILNTDATIQKR